MDRLTRRRFLGRAASSAAALAIGTPGMSLQPLIATETLLRGRFLTHISVVRVNQIEVTPERSIGQTSLPTTARSESVRGVSLPERMS